MPTGGSSGQVLAKASGTAYDVAWVNQSGGGGSATVIDSVNTVAASGAAQTLPDVITATVHDITLTATCSFTFPSAAPGKSFTLILRQDATGGRTVNWPTVLWPSNTLPVRTTSASAIDVLTFWAVGNAWAGAMAAKDIR